MNALPSALWSMTDVVAATGGRAAGGGPAWSATGVSIDSRTCQPGDLFIAIRGENFDGHDFVAGALEAGAAAALVQRVPDGVAADCRLIVVADCDDALTALGRKARDRSKARFVCVTGSVGKTGTKEALALAFGALGATHATRGNLNNHWGVPLTLARMPRDTAFAVIEMGMNHAGELSELSRIARPDVAIITTIAAVHLEFFEHVGEIADAKSEIFDGMSGHGTAVINRDNIYFATLATRAWARGLERIVGFGAHPDSDVRLVSYEPGAQGGTVAAAIAGRTLTFSLPVAGRHWAVNSLAVLAAVDALGGDLDRAAAALTGLAAPKGRGMRHAVAIAGGTLTVIDDSYNASPASVRAALAVLGACEPGADGRRIAVLGDMLELGREAETLHAALAGELRANGVALAFTAGPLMGALDRALPDDIRGGHADSSAALLPRLLDAVRPGDVILVKGSFGSRMGPVVEALLALGAAAGSDTATAAGEAKHAL